MAWHQYHQSTTHIVLENDQTNEYFSVETSDDGTYATIDHRGSSGRRHGCLNLPFDGWTKHWKDLVFADGRLYSRQHPLFQCWVQREPNGRLSCHHKLLRNLDENKGRCELPNLPREQEEILTNTLEDLGLRLPGGLYYQRFAATPQQTKSLSDTLWSPR